MKKILLLLLLFITAFGITTNAQPGANDPSFNPITGANGPVSVSAIQSDGKIIIGGGFNSYNGTGRIGITRLNANSSLDETFNSAGTGADNWVNTIAIQSDGKIIIGGDFGNYNGTSRIRIARLNANGTLDASFNPGTGANGRIETCIIQSDGKIIIGGHFSAFNGTPILRIARLNTDGSLDPFFNPGTGPNNTIKSVALQSDGKIIIGGWFTSYNGIARNRIARLLTDGTFDATLNAGTGTDNAIEKCTIQSDGRIIISGEFTNYNGTARSRIARLNADGSLDGTFNPGTGASSSIWPCVIQSDGKIIIGGFFTSYNGTSRNRIARLNTDGSIDVSFNPGTGADNWIYTTAIQSDGKIFIGGEFFTYNGGARNYSARLNADGTLDGTFNPGGGASNQIYTSAIQSDGKIIIGGQFTNYNGTAINRITRINTDGSIDGTFNPGTGVNSLVWTSAIQSDGKIIIGGQFITYNGTTVNRIARLNTDGSLDGTFNTGTGADNTVNTTAIQSDGKIIIAGNFSNYNGTARSRVARLNADGTLDGTFSVGTGANNQVYTIAIQSDGKIIIAGNFTSYNGTAINRIARLNTDGTLDGTFNVGTGANNLVGTSVIQSDGKIIIGGNFTSYNGTALNRIVRLNANGSIDGTFNVGTGVNGTIERSTIQSDGKIIIVGSFTDYNGTTRNRIARLNTDGTIDATLNPVGGPNSTVNTIAIQSDGKIIFGGVFTSYNGISRNRVARILGDCINNTVTPASSTPSVCINLAVPNITHTTTGATGIGIATGLPAGVTANWTAGTITISGTPTANGIFNYGIPLTGGCGIVNATGTITVILINTVSAASATPIVCINKVLTNITHATAGASGIGTATGLPPGLTANWAANTITISGTPTVTGIFNYTIPLTGGCGVISATGIINVITFAPTQVPVAFNFARTLSTNSVPPGAISQWYKNDTLIAGATATSYYAAAAGTFTVKFVNDCGPGPASNAFTFSDTSISQTITFPHVPTQSMSPTAKVILMATASSSLSVFYQIISGPGNMLNDTLLMTGAGTIIVKAIQPGDNIYNAAPPVNDTITVIKGNQVITFDSIPPQIYDANYLDLVATSSMGLATTFSLVAGSAYAYLNQTYTFRLTKIGAGLVTVRASQIGDPNYNAAVPVERTFCIGVRTLTPITGDANPCIATYRYNTQKIPGAIYVWTLNGGGILTTNNDTAWVQWQTPGSYSLTVKANSPCDAVYTNTQSLAITTSTNVPGIVSSMLPANNAIDQQLPLTLSWIPGNNTVNYDLFLWDSAAVEPVTPYASNIAAVSYVIPLNALVQNKTYKWKIVSKNPCSQTAGPIQKFKVIPLPDLVVSDVQAPATANSGQTITISWKVTNIGPGRTLPGTTWSDGVYFALDTLPNVNFNSANWDPNSWNAVNGNGIPLLLGKKVRPSSLDSGQFYTNTLDFTLPLNYNFPVYVYVITDNQHPNYKILQVSVANDTARKQNPILISLAPTPDLRVDSVFSPASTFSGSTVNLTYKVKNYGVVTPAGASWNDAVYMSQNPLFDSSTAIRVKAAKANGSYYPAGNAQTTVNTQLLPDSTYTRSLQVVVPNFIFGTWFFYVKANNDKILYEGALSNNNINQAQIQVYLTPTPKLTVSTLTVPITNASTTQPVGANWNIHNDGFRDNIEKNKGHYITMSTCSVPCPPGSPPGSSCFVPAVIRDSVVFGSSYWLDRVYLSTDSTGLNLANAILVKDITHGVLNSGLNADPPSGSYIGCPAIVSGNVNVHTVINPGSDFPIASNFTIPSNLQSGNYYVYVYTNPTKTVFEYPGTAQIKRSTLPITVSRPDATVPYISVPANTVGGTTVNINYTVTNNGPGAVFNHIRKDRLYISNFSTFDGSAQLLDSLIYTENLPVATGVPHSFTYAFPLATTGAKYFFVHTNYDSTFRETNSLNNLSAAAMTIVSAALPADLIVSNIQMPVTTFTIFTQTLTYTVFNNGTGTTAGTWTDSVYFSCSATFNFSTNNYMAKKSQTRAVPPGGSYTDTITFTIPQMSYEINPCFPQNANQNAYFYIKTNAGLTIYEGSNTNNNVTGTGNRPFTNPLVDHIVTTVSAPDTTTVGFAYPVNWRVKNIGYNPNNNYYYLWADAIYFSTDSIADVTDVVAGDYLKYLRLNTGQDSADSESPYTPVLLTGDYYVYVKTNSRNSIPGEKVLSNNVNFIRNGTGAAKKIYVIRPALADLTDTIASAPVTVATGQPITVIYKVINNGTGTTYPGTSWQNELRLSVDFFANPNDGDRLLASRNRNGVLTPGQFYYDTVTVTIPSNTIPGNYVLISKANSNNVVVESNINNNLGFSLINVFAPPVTDLIVSNVLKPDTVYLGYTMDTAKWVVTNASAVEARGYSSDGIYLSSGNLFDSTAILIGIKSKNIIMPPLQSDTVRLAPLVTGVVEGNYNVFVKTDLVNQIIESDKNNNTGISATPIYVKVKELLVNVPELATLQTISRYYKMKIPDSLRGATILVTLKTNDSLTMRNEMFIGGGYIPTPAQYNYRFEIPNYGNQQIVMTSVTDSVYYIMYRCVSPNPVLQNITLKAVKLPFAILNVHTNSGGNIGNVTVRIRGSLYRDSMIAKLSNGVTTIYASAVYFTNSTQVFATFPLQGKPLGVYNVTLMKPDSSVAILPNGFSIVPANNGGLITGGGFNTGAGNGNAPGCDPGAASGLNSQLVVELVVPQRVFVNRFLIIQINYSNPTNFDIPAQSRILYSEAGMKMAFTKEGIPTGTTSLYLELVETGGPPGIIRAGGSGTITVHTRAPGVRPQPNPFVLFKLK